ncbi:MAG: hypothetical protein IPK46_10515 [Saprospiraceae bacterium]|nr:hypothetical protein [Saprospiraceae bacterium]
MKFNPQSSLYDCYLHIAEGNAFTKKERIQFNAQVSFVLPAEAEMNIIETHMPLKDNLHFGGNNAAKWYITNKIENPAALRGQRIVSVTPDLSPTGQYNELREGDMVKLFSFNVYPLPTCGEAVRLFDNAKDPGSSAEGLRGGDFSNGFTIGGTAQNTATTFQPTTRACLMVISNLTNQQWWVKQWYWKLAIGNMLHLTCGQAPTASDSKEKM